MARITKKEHRRRIKLVVAARARHRERERNKDIQRVKDDYTPAVRRAIAKETIQLHLNEIQSIVERL